jgi:hypothetical protein
MHFSNQPSEKQTLYNNCFLITLIIALSTSDLKQFDKSGTIPGREWATRDGGRFNGENKP